MAMGWLHDHPHRLEQALGGGRAGELAGFIAAGHALAAQLLGPETWRPCEGILLPGDEREAAELQSAVAVAVGAGERLLEPATMQAEHGLLAPWAGCTRHPAAAFDPLEVLAVLAQQAVAAGVALIPGCPVGDLDDGDGGPLLHTHAGTTAAELVLLCAGVGGAGLDASLARWLVPVRHCALRIEGPLDSGLRSRLSLSSWFGQLRARGLAEGGWVLAGGRCASGQEELPPGLEGALVATLCGQLGWDPGDVRTSHRWTREAAHTRDGLPLVGPVPGRVRRVLCTGFCDHDADLAFAAAQVVCQGILGQHHELPGCLESRRVLDA